LKGIFLYIFFYPFYIDDNEGVQKDFQAGA